jgi:hypothetical protein
MQSVQRAHSRDFQVHEFSGRLVSDLAVSHPYRDQAEGQREGHGE